MTGDLTAWKKAKAVLHIIDDDERETVEFLISAASAQAEKIADRVLAARDVDITIDSNGGTDFLLPSWPVNAIEKVTVNGRELESGGYSVKAQSGILRVRERVPEGWDAIVFKGNIGYDPVPEDLQQAVIEVISANLRRFKGTGGNVGIKAMSANNMITTQYELDMPVTSRSVFMSYKGARV
jgi:hypothetical protein